MKAVRLTAGELTDAARETLHGHSCFASPGFANLWQSVGGRPVYFAAETDSGLAALLPAIEFGRKPLLRLQAMPDGCYSSLVMINQDLEVAEIAKAGSVILDAIADYGYARVFITDQQNLFVTTKKYEVQTCATTLVDISDPDWKPAERNVGTEIRAAQRRGVKVIPFERERHLDSFLSLLQSLKDSPQRVPKNPEQFYSALADLSNTDSRVRWLVIEHEQKVVASLVSVVERDMVLAWHGCFDRELGSALKPNNLLFHSIVSIVRPLGVRYFNLGATPPGATGAETFKKKWGGEQYTYQTLVLRSGLGKLR